MRAFLDMKETIKKILMDNIPDAECKFFGDSCNLRLEVASKTFADMSLINQHKTVMKLLQNKFESGELHALSLETKII
jgi:acid stress-induced BolA-like protein IbaG/YrbA